MFGVLRYSASNKMHYTLANRHVFVGDFKLKAEKVDKVSTFNLFSSVSVFAPSSASSYSSTGQSASTKEVWGLQHAAARASLTKAPLDHSGAAVATIQSLSADPWWNRDIQRIELSFTVYDEFVGFFSRVLFAVDFTESGRAHQWFVVNVADVFSYTYATLYIMDTCFFIVWFYVALMESVDMYKAWRQGFGELIDYFGFWNIVDWMSITIGFVLIMFIIILHVFTLDSRVTVLLSTSRHLATDPMNLSIEELDGVNHVLDYISVFSGLLAQSMALNTVSIVAKFFKGFSSNPRLSLVSSTIINASYDFIHFGIVLFAIFLPFVMIGHVMFGRDIPAFGNMMSSVSNAFLVLFGEFFWYIDAIDVLTFGGVLPSGTPKVLVQFWYMIYMFIVFLVLLNLLLAIIIEHYTTVTGRLASNPDAVPLWVQLRRYNKFKLENKGFIPLQTLRLQLEDDDEPAHVELAVSKDSLQKAFPTMTDEQAGWMMDFLEHELEIRRSHEDETEEPIEEDEATNFEMAAMRDALSRARVAATSIDDALIAHTHASNEPTSKKHSHDVKGSLPSVAKPTYVSTSQQTAATTQLPRDVTQKLQRFMELTKREILNLNRDQARMGKRIDGIIAAVSKSQGDMSALSEAVKRIGDGTVSTKRTRKSTR
eukprot:TRINITY_DN11479_c0_g2_i1.p1 TRINITY_DN11479_c0_g2~~TRINITY_DN11479_c0_g2_i1.p1  ORF type:complete len:725 (-),score=64.98 TRINITY_DN11479_c0_g2_i1:90-2048(-)